MAVPVNPLECATRDAICRLQESLYGAMHIASEITDSHGVPFCGLSADPPFCRLMKTDPQTGNACAESRASLNAKACGKRQPFFQECGNLGVVSACIPIIIEDAHVATWKLGRVRTRETGDEEVRAFAAAHGLPEENTLAAYKALPFLSESEFAHIVKMAELLAGTLAETARATRLMREARQEKERLLTITNTVMDNVDALVYINDPQTYRIAFANKYAHDVTGRKSLEGALCYEVLQQRNSPCPFCPFPKLFNADGSPTGETVHTEFHNDKLHRDFMITDSAVQWRDGKIMHMEVAADVTERNELAAAQAGTVARREFLARMSHELRTPMNGVLGMTHLALGADPPPRQREYLQKIQASASLLLSIINDILDFSRIEAGKLNVERALFNVRETIANATEFILPQAQEKGIGFVVSVGETVPEQAFGDSVRISQVLLNLVGNAVKFTKEGMVAVAVEAASPAPGKIRLQCTVKDSGIGVDPDRIGDLFAPFSQADGSITRKFGGTGLGLAIAKMLVELMGGEIGASSVPGEGSIFSFYVILDEAEQETTPAPEPAEEENAESVKGLHALVVEDNAINQEIILSLLEEMDVSADVAGDGVQGLEAFMKRDYDIIFMDIRMPVMDGLEATRKIRESGKSDAADVPIVAMTANAMEEDKRACLEAGMDAHIAKPIIVDDLEKALRRYARKKSLSRE